MFSEKQILLSQIWQSVVNISVCNPVGYASLSRLNFRLLLKTFDRLHRATVNPLRIVGRLLRAVGKSLRTIGCLYSVAANPLRTIERLLRVTANSYRTIGYLLRATANSLRAIGRIMRELHKISPSGCYSGKKSSPTEADPFFHTERCLSRRTAIIPANRLCQQDFLQMLSYPSFTICISFCLIANLTTSSPKLFTIQSLVRHLQRWKINLSYFFHFITITILTCYPKKLKNVVSFCVVRNIQI